MEVASMIFNFLAAILKQEHMKFNSIFYFSKTFLFQNTINIFKITSAILSFISDCDFKTRCAFCI